MPRSMPNGENTFIFSREDKDPELFVDFGRIVVLTRVGSVVHSRFQMTSMEVACTAEADSAAATWEVWGTDRTSPDTDGMIFFDHAPTKVRLVRIRIYVESGLVSLARIGAVFAYGFKGGIGANG